MPGAASALSHRRVLPPPVGVGARRGRPRRRARTHQARRGAARPGADAEGRGRACGIRRRRLPRRASSRRSTTRWRRRHRMPGSTCTSADLAPTSIEAVVTTRRDRPALLGGPGPARCRRHRLGETFAARGPGERGRLPVQRGGPRWRTCAPSTTSSAPGWSTARARSSSPGTPPSATSPTATGSARRASRASAPTPSPTPRPCASSPSTCAPRESRPSTRRRSSPPPWPRRSPARPAPASPSSTRSKASRSTSAGADYLEVMRANLRTLREGQQCT